MHAPHSSSLVGIDKTAGRSMRAGAQRNMLAARAPYIRRPAFFALKDGRARSMKSTIEDLRLSLHHTFNTERNGGSIIVRDDSTLMLRNYNVVHLRLIDAVKTQYPHVEIYFEHHAQSSSGFVVFFVFKPKRAVLTSSGFFQFMCLACLVLCFYGIRLHAVPFDVI
jgi:hypothetical protein